MKSTPSVVAAWREHCTHMTIYLEELHNPYNEESRERAKTNAQASALFFSAEVLHQIHLEEQEEEQKK